MFVEDWYFSDKKDRNGLAELSGHSNIQWKLVNVKPVFGFDEEANALYFRISGIGIMAGCL